MTKPKYVEVISRGIDAKMAQGPQMDYLWRVDLPPLDQVVDPTGQGVVSRYRSLIPESDATYFTQEVVNRHLSHRVYEIATPYTAFDTRKSIDAASFRYAVDRSDIGSITMVMDEMEDGLTLRYLLAWQSLMNNPNGTRNPPVIYKKPVVYWSMSGTK